MKKRIYKSTFNKYFTLQEHADNLRRSIESCDQLYINGYEVDKQSISEVLDCISASIEELYEKLCF